MESRFCKYCNCEHPLTKEHYCNLEKGKPTCRKRQNQKAREWNKKHRERELRKSAERYAKNKEKILAKRKKYTYEEYGKAYYHKRKLEDNMYKIAMNLRTRLRNALRNGYCAGSSIRDLGCSIQELKKYLESKFKSGMTWENYGYQGWHIDHIRPLCSFNLGNESEVRQAVHYTNLQPLWAEENMAKNRKYVDVPCEGDLISKSGKIGGSCDPKGRSETSANTELSQEDNTSDQRNAYQMNLEIEYNSGTSVRPL